MRITARITEPQPLDHCLQPDACVAIVSGRHCRACAMKHMHRDPAVRQRRLAGLAAYHASPGVKAALVERVKAGRRAAMENPDTRERMRERGREQVRKYLNDPEVRARSSSPDARARAAAKTRERRFAGIPQKHRDLYVTLTRTKRLSAADARKLIRDLVDQSTRDARRSIAEIEQAQRERAAREKAERY